MKTIYLAGRLDAGETDIAAFSDELEGRGHTVLEKWFLEGRLPKPYLDHPVTSARAAQAMIHAAFESEVMILFPTDDILGAAVEFGAALGSREVHADKRIMVVNPYDVRQSVFYVHPAALAVESLADIRQLDWY